MRAIVQEGYGSPDVLQLREIDGPVVAVDRGLVRVRAASVNAAHCHLLRPPRPANERIPVLQCNKEEGHNDRYPGLKRS